VTRHLGAAVRARVGCVRPRRHLRHIAPGRAPALFGMRRHGSAEARLTETREQQTIAVAESLLDYHRGQLRKIYETAAALSQAVQEELQTISDFILAGYSDASAILLRPSLSAAGRLGTLDMHDSEISTFRRRMEEIGVL
jgi:hypothetical protein